MKFKICMIMLFLNCGLQASNSDLEKLIARESFVREQTPLACRKGLVESEEAKLALITNITEYRSRLRNPNLTKADFKVVYKGLPQYYRYLENGSKVESRVENIKKKHSRILPFIPNYVSPETFENERLDLEKDLSDVVDDFLKKRLQEALAKQGQIAHNPSAPLFPEVQTAVPVNNLNNNSERK